MDKIRIELLTGKEKQIWDDFVDDSNNGTIFHKQKFLSYHKDKFKDNEHHLLFYQGSQLISVLPLAIFESKGEKVAKSPYGASFGGFVYKKVTYSNVSKIIKSFKEYAIENNFDKIIITPPPLIYHTRFETYQDFCLLKEGFKIVNRNITNIIELQKIKTNNLFDLYKYSCVKQIQKANRLNITVKEIGILKSFYDILIENRKKHNVIPVHSFSELLTLKKLFPKNIILLGAYLKKELIGGALCFAVNKQALLNFYTCHKEKYSGHGCVNLLYHKCIGWALENDFTSFDLGTSSLNMVANEGLLTFKESFGSTAIFRDTYILEL